MSGYSDHLQKVYPTARLYDALVPRPSGVDMIDLSPYGLDNLGKVGEGAFSKVYIVREKKTKNIYACKYTSLRHAKAKPSFIAEHTLREILCMNTIQRKNIYGTIPLIKYYPSAESIQGYIQKYQNVPSIFVPSSAVILQLMPVGIPYEAFMESFFRSGRRLSEKDVASLVLDLVFPLDYIHKKGNIIHRDIKPGNILLVKSKSGRVHAAISDFNISKEFTSTMTLIGTKEYANPGYLKKVAKKKLTKIEAEKNDVYAVGQIMFILLNRTMAPIRGTIPAPKDSPSVRITALLQQMLDPNIENVPTTSQVIRRCEAIMNNSSVRSVSPHKNYSKKNISTKIYRR